MLLEEKIARKLKKNKKTLATAESCTGGLLAHKLTNISGSSHYFLGGVLTYSNESKRRLLNVPARFIKQHGVVSSPVAGSMATGVRRLLKTDYGVSITGIAGPTGGTLTKPVGLVFVAVASRSKEMVREYRFKGTRQQIKNKAAGAALKLFFEFI